MCQGVSGIVREVSAYCTHPLTVQLCRAGPKAGEKGLENAIKLVAYATGSSPGVEHLKKSFRTLFARFRSSPTRLYS